MDWILTDRLKQTRLLLLMRVRFHVHKKRHRISFDSLYVPYPVSQNFRICDRSKIMVSRALWIAFYGL